MSHDQKPGRMRVVAGPAAEAQRRRDDGAVAQDTGAGADTGIAPAVAAASALATGKSSKTHRLLAVLFVAGCALGGAGLPLLVTL